MAIDTVVTLGHGELRGKVHLSHRCLALADWNGLRLRRCEDRPTGFNVYYEWQRLCAFSKEPTQVLLVTREETPGNQSLFQITHNSVMGSIHSYKANILGVTPVK